MSVGRRRTHLPPTMIHPSVGNDGAEWGGLEWRGGDRAPTTDAEMNAPISILPAGRESRANPPGEQTLDEGDLGRRRWLKMVRAGWPYMS